MFLSIAWILLRNLLITLPTLLIYGSRKLFYRLKSLLFGLPSGMNLISPVESQDVIVLVHGRGGHPIDFYSLIRQLDMEVKQQYKILNVHLENTRNTRIDEDVESLFSQLEFLTNCRITLIGHSKGGIIACRYLARTADPRITRIITVSSPLLGTQVANYAFGVVRTDLNYQNATLIETELKLQDYIDKLYHIVATNDNIIIPHNSGYYSSTYEYNQNQVYFYQGKYNHCCLFDDPTIVKVIRKWIMN